MPEPTLEARLAFLDRSARLLHEAAPSSSAYLMSQRNLVAEQNEKSLSKAQLKDICKACGTILMPDLTLKREITDQGIAKRNTGDSHNLESDGLMKRIRTECLICRRVVLAPVQPSQQRQDKVIPLRSTQAMGASKTSASDSDSIMEKGVTQVMKHPSANESSRKRSKARKQGGLQALLEKSKDSGSRPPGFGLDLMDFLKDS
ncbi:MAG: hypothetical protein Q9220_002919 [cf. Caloplaca sp. 1 TL-2023]